MPLPEGFVLVRERARPLAPDERREAILDAVLPLLRERGKDVTSRELAEAAGVAEGTLFRAFGDKETLLQSGLARLLDPALFHAMMRTIPRTLPLEEKLAAVIELLRTRFQSVFAVMTVFQQHGPPPRREGTDEWVEIFRELLDPDVPRLAVPIDTLAYYVRLVAFGSSIEKFNATRPFDPAELASLLAHGVATP